MESTLKCSGCDQDLPKADFAVAQQKKKEGRKCKNCTGASAQDKPVGPGEKGSQKGNAPKPAASSAKKEVKPAVGSQKGAEKKPATASNKGSAPPAAAAAPKEEKTKKPPVPKASDLKASGSNKGKSPASPAPAAAATKAPAAAAGKAAGKKEDKPAAGKGKEAPKVEKKPAVPTAASTAPANKAALGQKGKDSKDAKGKGAAKPVPEPEAEPEPAPAAAPAGAEEPAADEKPKKGRTKRRRVVIPWEQQTAEQKDESLRELRAKLVELRLHNLDMVVSKQREYPPGAEAEFFEVAGFSSTKQKEHLEAFALFLDGWVADCEYDVGLIDCGPGDKAPELSVVNKDGATEKIATTGKITLLQFWASWSKACVEPLRKMEEFARQKPEWADKVSLVAISMDEDIQQSGPPPVVVKYVEDLKEQERLAREKDKEGSSSSSSSSKKGSNKKGSNKKGSQKKKTVPASGSKKKSTATKGGKEDKSSSSSSSSSVESPLNVVYSWAGKPINHPTPQPPEAVLKYDIQRVPEYVLISPDGIVVKRGNPEGVNLERDINKLLAGGTVDGGEEEQEEEKPAVSSSSSDEPKKWQDVDATLRNKVVDRVHAALKAARTHGQLKGVVMVVDHTSVYSTRKRRPDEVIGVTLSGSIPQSEEKTLCGILEVLEKETQAADINKFITIEGHGTLAPGKQCNKCQTEFPDKGAVKWQCGCCTDKIYTLCDDCESKRFSEVSDHPAYHIFFRVGPQSRELSNTHHTVGSFTALPSFLAHRQPGTIVHDEVFCNGCKQGPVQGYRYKCAHCPDFDYCERCFTTHIVNGEDGEGAHPAWHVFIKIHDSDNVNANDEEGLEGDGYPEGDEMDMEGDDEEEWGANQAGFEGDEGEEGDFEGDDGEEEEDN